MRVMTDGMLELIKKSELERGYKAGASDGYKRGFGEGRLDGLHTVIGNKQEAMIKAYKEAPVTIEFITLISEAQYQYVKEMTSHTFRPAKYLVKFRSKSSMTTSEITVTFDTPDFSMADVRRKITEEFCGGGCV